MKPESFAGTKPTLTFEEYFKGDTIGYGILFNRSGGVRRQFVVEMHGTQNGNQFTLDEYFTFLDGERLTRQWVVTKLDENHYEATASDVKGKAIGKQFGSVIQWQYVLRVPVKGSTYDISFDDWMFLQDDDVMINRAQMTKFGFSVGEMVLTFRKTSRSSGATRDALEKP